MLVDNITYQNARGQISNLANDGSPNDVLIVPLHPAMQEWNGVSANAVVIYALDTPSIMAKAPAASLAAGASVLLSALASATDPAGRGITKYQVYNSGVGDHLVVGNAAESANSVATAVTVTSLAAVALQAGAAAGADNVEVRAFNGAYWGDWQNLVVNVSVPAPKPPVLVAQTASQTWLQGQKVALVLPAGLFTDPQHQALTYSATGIGGAALPAWLAFNPATHAFAGTVPAGLEQLSIVVTATDKVGLASAESFAVTVPAAAPTVAVKVAAQSWGAGSVVSFALPVGNFADPQGQVLTYKATLASGAALPGWLIFDAETKSVFGTAPANAQAVQLKITATDSSKLSASETIAINIVKATTGLVLGDWQQGNWMATPDHAGANDARHGVGAAFFAGGLAAPDHFVSALVMPHHHG
jgi:hypothetical protein